MSVSYNIYICMQTLVQNDQPTCLTTYGEYNRQRTLRQRVTMMT